MPRARNPFIGYWKITRMDEWDSAYIDLVVPGFFEFEREDGRLMGSFQFGTVAGWLDCRIRSAGGESYVEWSWEGHSDTDPACGRGWARVEGERLVGRLFIHASDDSAFEASRQNPPPSQRQR